MQLLIDGDLIAFRCAATVTDVDAQDIAVLRCDQLVRELLHSTESESYQLFLTGRNNFRKRINPEYKANRKDKALPVHLNACKEFLTSEWKAETSTNSEADDLLGISQSDVTMIASLDKDLLMIPGWHFNWLKNERTYTVPDDGIRRFYKQMLIGDRSDNIFGVDKIGPVKADRIIDPLETEKEIIEQVLYLYGDDFQRFLINAQCLWIMQNKGETWAHRVDHSILPDPLRQEAEVMLSSMRSLMEDISTEPIMNPVKMSGTSVVGIVPESIPTETVPLT